MPEENRLVHISKPPVLGVSYIGDEVELSPFKTRDMKNMLVKDLIMQRRLGLTQIAASYPNASNPIIEGFEYGDASGNLHTLFFDTAEMVELDVGAGTWADRSGGSDFTGDENNHIFPTTVGGVGAEDLYVTNGNDAIKRWTGSGNWSNLSVTGFTTLLAKSCIGYRGHLVLGNTIEDGTAYPYRIRWSTVGTPGTWNTITAGFINLIEDTTNSEIMCMHPLGQNLIVYKFDSIYQLIYEGDPNYFVQIPREMQEGAISPKAVAPFPNGHLVVTNENIHVFDGFSFIRPTPGDEIKEQFFDELNWAARDQVRAINLPGESQIWILLPTGVSTVPNKAWCWDWRRPSWTPHEFGETLYSLLSFKKSFSNQQGVACKAGNAFYFLNGNTDNGTNIDGYFTTKLNDYRELSERVGTDIRDLMKILHMLEIDIEDNVPYVQVGHKNVLNPDTALDLDAVQTPIEGPTGLYQTTHQDRVGKYISLKIGQNDNEAPFKIRQMRSIVEPLGADR